MTIPIYRHNRDHDDWEVASVYDSDDCDSLGRSAYDESLHSSGSPALHPQGRLYDDTGALVRYSVPQQQHQNYSPVAFTRPRLEPRYVPGKQNNNNFIVPPPGVIFPPKDRALSPQDTYWPPTPVQMATSATSSSKMPMDKRLLETPSPPPPPSLLLSPSSPPRASSPLIRRPSPATAIAHGQPPHGTSIAMSGSGTGTNVISHASPMMAPPPRYHEVAHPISPRLAEAGRQAHSDIVMNPPRRSGHGVLSSSYAPGPGRAPMPWGAQSSEGMTVVDGRYGAGHPGYGPAGRTDAYPARTPATAKYEYDAGGRTRPQTRERKGSIWRRFVRRFGPSQVSVGQT